jgi:serine O-acetyltransferase
LMPKISYPKNHYISNGRIAQIYLYYLQRKWRVPAKLLGFVLNCAISCDVPKNLFMPHPFGIIVDTHSKIGNNAVLCQQVTLGVVNPYFHSEVDPMKVDPMIGEGVYVGPGAKILGHITIGEWSVIGANAVITIDVPPHSIAVGYNKILGKKTTEL